MTNKIFTCCRCGKELTPEKTSTEGFAQIRFRHFTLECAWESDWKNLCKECFDELIKGGDIDGS